MQQCAISALAIIGLWLSHLPVLFQVQLFKFPVITLFNRCQFGGQ